jgi:hypothetical protein
VNNSQFEEEHMIKQLQGIALILFSILLTITFEVMDIIYVFDLSIEWVHIFLVIGIAGIIMVFSKPKSVDK